MTLQKSCLWIFISIFLFSSLSAAVQDHDPLPTYLPVFDHGCYIVDYDARTKNPAWVYEKLTTGSLKGSTDRSSFTFMEDKLIPPHMRPSNKDYLKSGFDKGHLAPAANHKDSEENMAETFLLTNISPQRPQFNRGYWAKLEKHVRDLTKSYKTVHVITGPLFLPEENDDGTRWVKYQVIGETNIAVPTHFFKVLILETLFGDIEQRAYILPNIYIRPDVPFEKFQSTIQSIECLSGIIFNRSKNMLF